VRVLHVINSMSPRCGGTTTAMWNILAALRIAGVEADLATTDDDGPGRLGDVEHGRFVCEQGQRVIRFPRQMRTYTCSVPLLAWLSRNVGRYDLVEAHGLFTFAPLVASAAAHARGIRYLVRPNGVLNRWGRAHRRPRAKRVSLRWVEGPLLRRAARVIFTSPAELQEAGDLGIAMRSVVVPLGLARPEGLAPIPGPGLRQGPTVEPVTPVRGNLLFLARIDPIKNLETLLRAAASVATRHPGLRLTIAGDGDVAYVRQLRGLAQALGLQSRTDWLGFVDGPAKEAALRSADFLVLPSASENFGLAAAEALARGVPVIVTTGVGIADPVRAAGAGYVCEPSDRALADALDRALSDPDRRDTMCLAAHRLYEREFSLEIMGARLRDTYEAIRAER
jgi:glycosyltransferase involved in cell wall biosynthesis